MLILYGGLGFLGMKLSRKLGFADICDPKVSNKQRFLIPALVGVLIGIFFIIADTIFSLFHNMALPHPPFPTSLIASAIAGIGEEAIFRLFFHLFLGLAYFPCYSKKEVAESDFLDCSNFISYRICFQAYSISNDSFGFELNEIPFALMSEIFLLNGVLSLFAAYYFRKFGFLAAVGIHFWTDIVWHVIWGDI